MSYKYRLKGYRAHKFPRSCWDSERQASRSMRAHKNSGLQKVGATFSLSNFPSIQTETPIKIWGKKRGWNMKVPYFALKWGRKTRARFSPVPPPKTKGRINLSAQQLNTFVVFREFGMISSERKLEKLKIQSATRYI